MQQGQEPAIVDLVPFGSEPVVQRFMQTIEQGGDSTSWERLAARHPAFLARWFRDEVARSTSLDPRQRYRMSSRLAELARRAPDAALALVQALFDLGEELSALAAPLGRLVRFRPREAFDLLKARHESGRPEHLEAAEGIVRDALDAADLSPATAAALERWVVRLFRFDGAWGRGSSARCSPRGARSRPGAWARA